VRNDVGSRNDTVMSVQTLSYNDLPYPIQTDAVYHSACRRAATSRLSNQLSGPIRLAMQQTMADPASKQVWAIVFEYDGQPMYVVQNMKYTLQCQDQRRVLRVCLYLEPST
jgi:hypothetical protein